MLPYAGDGRFATIAILAAALGVQNTTVRHLGAPDLTTTVLTLTLTGLAADSVLAGGPGARPHRRLGSVAAMLAGAAAGAGLLQLSPTAVLARRGRPGRRRLGHVPDRRPVPGPDVTPGQPAPPRARRRLTPASGAGSARAPGTRATRGTPGAPSAERSPR